MLTRTNIAVRGFVKGVLAPLAVVSSMYGMPRQDLNGDYDRISIRPEQSDFKNIRRDFKKAIARVKREKSLYYEAQK